MQYSSTLGGSDPRFDEWFEQERKPFIDSTDNQDEEEDD